MQKQRTEKGTCESKCLFHGGDGEDRTLDLLNAIQALSQLSYAPEYLIGGDSGARTCDLSDVNRTL